MTKIALVDRYGAYLKAREGRFQLYVKGEKIWDVAPVELDAIVFTVTGALISVSAIKLANEFGIDLVFFEGNKPIARLIQARYGSTLKTWLKQLKIFRNKVERVRLARLFAEGKIHNQKVVLRDYYKYYRASGKKYFHILSAIETINKILNELKEANSSVEIMNLEAQAAKIYWKTVSSILPREVGFNQRITRSRMPPNGEIDVFNRALNIGYGILGRIVWKAIFIAGLNPYISFLHKPRAGKMTLIFDLMEEFRPIVVDRPLIAAFRRDYEKFIKLSSNDREAVREVWKVIVKRIYESKPPMENKIIEQARLLAKHIRGTDRYRPFKAR